MTIPAKLFVLLLCAFAIHLVLTSASASAQTTDWLRVQSDDGEFSIEVPQNYKYYFNKDGFFIGRFQGSGSFRLTEMRMLNSYVNGSLLSFEIYNANRGALDSIFESDKYRRDNIKVSTVKTSGFSARQVVEKGDGYYLVRKYFSSKKNIYVLTAASRDGETEEIRHFLDSLVFDAAGKTANSSGGSLISSLPVSEITVGMNGRPGVAPVTPDPSAGALAPPDKKESLIILRKSPASYTDDARLKNVAGTVRLRVKFSDDGFIPHIDVLQTLPEGLLRQALFAAMRIKFLPKLDGGKPVTVAKLLEYSFSIY